MPWSRINDVTINICDRRNVQSRLSLAWKAYKRWNFFENRHRIKSAFTLQRTPLFKRRPRLKTDEYLDIVQFWAPNGCSEPKDQWWPKDHFLYPSFGSFSLWSPSKYKSANWVENRQMMLILNILTTLCQHLLQISPVLTNTERSGICCSKKTKKTLRARSLYREVQRVGVSGVVFFYYGQKDFTFTTH